jgi:hypothetical protein
MALTAPHRREFDRLDFWVLPGGGQPSVIFESGRLKAAPIVGGVKVLTTIAAAKESLDISPYQLLIVSACGITAAQNEWIQRKPDVHPLGYLKCSGWFDGEEPETLKLISSAMFEAAVESHVRQTASLKCAELLVRHFEGPILLQPWPAPSTLVRADPNWFVNRWYGARAREVWKAFFDAQWRALNAIPTTLGPRVAVLPYPAPHIIRNAFTDESLTAHDPWHGNPEYGSLVLEQIVRVSRKLRQAARTERSGKVPVNGPLLSFV